MVKVKCKDCKITGYTASPLFIVCVCGGRFRVIPEGARRKRNRR